MKDIDSQTHGNCYILLWTLLHALRWSYKAFVGGSHSWVLCRSRRAIWSPQAGAASSSSQARTDLALHSYSPHVCVCGPDWMTAMMTQSFLWVACFSKVAALPSLLWTNLRERCWVGVQRDTQHEWKGEVLPRATAFRPPFRGRLRETMWHYTTFFLNTKNCSNFLYWFFCQSFSQ